MEVLVDLDTNVLEFGSGDMCDIWGTPDVLDTTLTEPDGGWHPHVDCASSVVLRDRMITEASLPIRAEHSYCNDSAQLAATIKEEEDEMESECFPAISMSTATGAADGDQQVTLLQRRPSPVRRTSSPTAPSPSPTVPTPSAARSTGVASAPTAPRCLVLTQSRDGVQLLRAIDENGHIVKVSAGQSVVRPQTIVLTGGRPSLPGHAANSTDLTRLSIKVEPSSGFSLPPTPPSSSSDSEGGASPTHMGYVISRHLAQRSPKVLVTAGRSFGRRPIRSPLISSQLRGLQGILCLTEEEKRTLVTEGYSVPTRLPLSKSEERSLQKIRRKIKNKISAQESRRKKKEYMDQLERRVDRVVAENDGHQTRLAELQAEHHQLGSRHSQLLTRNALLLSQLAQLQLIVGKAGLAEMLKANST